MYRIDAVYQDAIFDWAYKCLNPNSLQKIQFNALGTAGTFTLTLGAQTTGLIAFDATAATIKTALELLTGINEVTVYYDMPALNLIFEFTGVDATLPFNNLVADITLLTGPTTATTTALQTANATLIALDWAYNDDIAAQVDWPFAVLNILDFAEEAEVAQVWKETDIYTEKHFNKFTLSVDIFGNSKQDHKTINWMKRLIRSYKHPVQRAALSAVNLAWRSFSGIRDLSALQDTKHELRAQADFMFAYGEEIDIVLGQFERASGTGSYTTDQGNVVNVDVDEQ